MIKKMTGYKATDKDMCCRGFQFEIGKLYEHKGKVELCRNGFHFCEHPSGVWAYYSAPDTRVFKVEAFEVSEEKSEEGALVKYVCRKIRFLEEIKFDNKLNTGYYNTGYSNTGYYNTGDQNTGARNTGARNTGDCNTGDCNTGYYNTGHRNTGARNTGNYNTGYYNTGHRNTGNYNLTDNCTGFFCTKEPTVFCFDVDTGLTKKEFLNKFPNVLNLFYTIIENKPIDYNTYKDIPGLSKETVAKYRKMYKSLTENKS